MAVHTTNAYGNITVTEEAIAQVAGLTALECYGVVDLVAKKFSDSVSELFHKAPVSRGVKVITSGDKIFIDLYVILKYGVSMEAVSESLKKAVKYDVEKFSGMVVKEVNVTIFGVKV